MRAHQAEYPIRTMCRVLEVSTSGYYAWRGRCPSARASDDERLKHKIKDSHDASRGTYGAPRIRKDLSEDGIQVSQRRVSRLMRSLEIQGVSRRRGFKTTRRSGVEPAPDLVNRDFTAKGPNRLWIADITYVPTMVGFVFLAIILDVWSRRVVGWSMRRDLKDELAIEALDMAVSNRGLCEAKHHSDCGSQPRFKESSQHVLVQSDCRSSSRTSAGVLQPSVLRGRLLRASATASRSPREYLTRSVPFGKYCRSSPLVFSFVPRCQGLCGSQK